ncbi:MULTISPECIES: hypothetical protein [unclassified Rhodococcus (in: high G+C Gram-positive bacteria)]|uniref:hypothetical protein n=1 Tax=unclassified Rhodococcus (in: high G+C Gram-positive bacteria) TaxID=192944 RepID=UPI0002A45D1A|nr:MULTISPECIES: hypothetical protein [unclassified Rhodococcus (in: high G+C Gram-positive bacteria)]ELB93442.1 hypothetical protein Rwratislav_08977 [Rhodococcus wratislaviensis IFP 2016]
MQDAVRDAGSAREDLLDGAHDRDVELVKAARDRTFLVRGDVFVFVSADDEWIHPPVVVVSDPIGISRSGGAVLYFLRIRTDLPPLPLTGAEKVLADPCTRLRTALRGLRTSELLRSILPSTSSNDMSLT